MPGLYNQEVAEFPGLEAWFLTAVLAGPKGARLPLVWKYIVNGDRKLKLRSSHLLWERLSSDC